MPEVGFNESFNPRPDRDYTLRKVVVDQVFGPIKGPKGLDRFRFSGLEKMTGE